MFIWKRVSYFRYTLVLVLELITALFIAMSLIHCNFVTGPDIYADDSTSGTG